VGWDNLIFCPNFFFGPLIPFMDGGQFFTGFLGHLLLGIVFRLGHAGFDLCENRLAGLILAGDLLLGRLFQDHVEVFLADLAITLDYYF
jgi:hypothetical protein